MQSTAIVDNSVGSRAAQLTSVVARVGIAAVIVLGCASRFASAAGAETTSPQPQQVGASNGGVASTTSDGNVAIGEIVTGQNTGNSISTGDIAGSAELDGGEISYPTEVSVVLIVEPSIASADGGDNGEATASADETTTDGTADRDGNGDITIINRNENRSSATAVG
jgi:hypothetical protein